MPIDKQVLRTVTSKKRLPFDPQETRLLPSWPLPNYAYVPGRFPHPSRDPTAHQTGSPPAPATKLDPAHWATNLHYLRGIDLFNCGYYWEAHEAWETLWHLAGRRGMVANFLKALIALAAAGVKTRAATPSGSAHHARRARSLFETLLPDTPADSNRFFGLSLPDLIHHARSIEKNTNDLTPSPGIPVPIVMPFRLSPRIPLPLG